VIRPNYAQPVIGTDSADARRASDFADRVVAAAGAGGGHRFDLVGFSLGAAVATFIAAKYSEMVRSLVLVSGFSYGRDPRMKLQFNLWLHLARTDKIALVKLFLVSGLSREFLSAFDENTIDGIIQSFVATSDWPLVEQNIKVEWMCGSKPGRSRHRHCQSPGNTTRLCHPPTLRSWLILSPLQRGPKSLQDTCLSWKNQSIWSQRRWHF
jgi:pimeloyl-ACP methyl ester carboxylesterase